MTHITYVGTTSIQHPTKCTTFHHYTYVCEVERAKIIMYLVLLIMKLAFPGVYPRPRSGFRVSNTITHHTTGAVAG